MVDTINPQTGSNDNFDQPSSDQAGSTIPAQSESFYAGFGKPEDVHLNLANDGISGQAKPANIEQNQTETPTQPSPAHSMPSAQSYVSPGVNSRLFLLIGGASLAVLLLVGLGGFFGSKASYSKKLSVQKNELSSIEAELSKEREAPEALELPVKTTPPASEQTPAVPAIPTAPTAPAAPTQTEPIETPTQPSPTLENKGMG